MSGSQLTLLGLEISVYTRIVRLALEEKKLDYVLKEVDIFVEGGPPASYLEYNPFGNIPCLLHDGFCLYETGAITRYIDKLSSESTLQPKDPLLCARMNQIISILDAYAYRPMVWDVFVQRIVVPEEGGLTDESIVSGALLAISKVLDQLEEWLRGYEFLAGTQISLADLHAFPMILYFSKTPEGMGVLESYPALQRWLIRINNRLSVGMTRSRYG